VQGGDSSHGSGGRPHQRAASAAGRPRREIPPLCFTLPVLLLTLMRSFRKMVPICMEETTRCHESGFSLATAG